MPSKKVRARERKAAKARQESPSATPSTLPTIKNTDALALITTEGTESDAMIAAQFIHAPPESQPTVVHSGGAMALLRTMPDNVPFAHAQSARLITYIFTRPVCRRRGDAHRLLRSLQKHFGALVAHSSNRASKALLSGCGFTCVDRGTRMYAWEKQTK